MSLPKKKEICKTIGEARKSLVAIKLQQGAWRFGRPVPGPYPANMPYSPATRARIVSILVAAMPKSQTVQQSINLAQHIHHLKPLERSGPERLLSAIERRAIFDTGAQIEIDVLLDRIDRLIEVGITTVDRYDAVACTVTAPAVWTERRRTRQAEDVGRALVVLVDFHATILAVHDLIHAERAIARLRQTVRHTEGCGPEHPRQDAPVVSSAATEGRRVRYRPDAELAGVRLWQSSAMLPGPTARCATLWLPCQGFANRAFASGRPSIETQCCAPLPFSGVLSFQLFQIFSDHKIQ